MTAPHKCPTCDGDMGMADIPKYNIYSCRSCGEVGQLIDGKISPLGSLLERNMLGDDEVHTAISKPHVNHVASFIEVFENATRMWQMDLAAASGGLRTILAQVENRVDFALAKISGLGLISDEAAQVERALREVRDLTSLLPSRSSGIQEEVLTTHGDGKVRG